jgi:hypothetical protein
VLITHAARAFNNYERPINMLRNSTEIPEKTREKSVRTFLQEEEPNLLRRSGTVITVCAYVRMS